VWCHLNVFIPCSKYLLNKPTISNIKKTGTQTCERKAKKVDTQFRILKWCVTTDILYIPTSNYMAALTYFSFANPWMQTTRELLRLTDWYEILNFKFVIGTLQVTRLCSIDDRIIDEYGVAGKKRIRSTRRNLVSVLFLSTANPTWLDLGISCEVISIYLCTTFVIINNYLYNVWWCEIVWVTFDKINLWRIFYSQRWLRSVYLLR
jgi:hypothetical protein